jgi:hypothetical protein
MKRPLSEVLAQRLALFVFLSFLFAFPLFMIIYFLFLR